MEIKQNPFSLYDFLGYFVPGAVFLFFIIYLLYLFEQWKIIESSITNNIDLNQLALYLPFTLIAYILGHALSFLSSITIERYSIWTIGYPSSYLMDLPHPKYLDVEEPKNIRYIVRIGFALFLFPITFFDIVLSFLFHIKELYAKPLDDVALRSVPNKISSYLQDKQCINVSKEDIKNRECEYFRTIDHYILEKAPMHVSKFQNYIALYGFNRTISFIFVVIFWVSMIILLARVNTNMYMIICATTFALFSYLFYLNFNKFYRRYSQEVIMAFGSIYEEKRKPRERKRK